MVSHDNPTTTTTTTTTTPQHAESQAMNSGQSMGSPFPPPHEDQPTANDRYSELRQLLGSNTPDYIVVPIGEPSCESTTEVHRLTEPQSAQSDGTMSQEPPVIGAAGPALSRVGSGSVIVNINEDPAAITQREPMVGTQPLVSMAPTGLTAPDAALDLHGGTITVFASNVQSASQPADDDANLAQVRTKFGRFRILIIGKANAGKTTILQKMCNTTEQPIIRDSSGLVLGSSVIQPTDGRGIHDINNELTFSSNPAFVFHDSPGFEAASTKEVDDVREFIASRAATRRARDQLHAIWYCLPTDNDRPLTNAEMRFFEESTGKAPVIAIFTKYDGMILREYNRLRNEIGLSRTEANCLAPKHADELFRNSEYYLKRLQGAKYPPARYLRVQDMQKPENTCAELSKQTIEALDNKKLQLLFLSVQQNNIELSAEYALKE